MTTEPADVEPNTGPPTVTIANEAVTVEIDAERGGRIAQITFHRTDLLIGEVDGGGDPMRWGCYPMVPWAGRVRDGQFQFDGTAYQLPISEDGHAIHGVGYTSAWNVADRTATHAALTLDLPSDASWPFGGSVRQQFAVDGTDVLLDIAVTADEAAFPVSFGWHPWFRKPERLDFRPGAMYRRVDGVAVDQQVDVQPGPWDDCFVNLEPVTAQVGEVFITLTSDCTDWVVYDEPAHATCVEPQSGPPDAFNIRPQVLEPGHSTSRWFRISFSA